MNGCFLVKSFYGFLRNGGVLCATTNVIWKSICPKKVNLFNWLEWDNSLLTLNNFAMRRCNRLPTTTCALCHTDIQTTDHLLIQCPLAERIWNFFTHTFSLLVPPTSLVDLWDRWKPQLPSHVRAIGEIIIRIITWNIWLERNARIFNNKYSSLHTIIVKAIYMMILWIDEAPESKKARLEGSVMTGNRSLEFFGHPSGSSEEGPIK